MIGMGKTEQSPRQASGQPANEARSVQQLSGIVNSRSYTMLVKIHALILDMDQAGSKTNDGPQVATVPTIQNNLEQSAEVLLQAESMLDQLRYKLFN